MKDSRSGMKQILPVCREQRKNGLVKPRLHPLPSFPMCASHSIGLLNGPNLGRLGVREPEIYGSVTLAGIEELFAEEAERLGVRIDCFQSNHEGALIDRLEKWTDDGFAGVVLNPGALTHTSVALRDAVAATGLPVVEVHLSNIHRREEFRHRSLTAGACEAVLAGLGAEGYRAALRFLVGRMRD